MQRHQHKLLRGCDRLKHFLLPARAELAVTEQSHAPAFAEPIPEQLIGLVRLLFPLDALLHELRCLIVRLFL
jgi:hypothetical protein